MEGYELRWSYLFMALDIAFDSRQNAFVLDVNTGPPPPPPLQACGHLWIHTAIYGCTQPSIAGCMFHVKRDVALITSHPFTGADIHL